MHRTAFVSGCFDLLHSGHVEFLQQAARWGRLTVGLGSDATIKQLKGQYPVCSEQERAFMLAALACVADVVISTGSGVLDFEPELRRLQPNVFVVNADGDASAKRHLCAELGVEYRVLQRDPRKGLLRRSTSAFRAQPRIPYRLDLAGGWLDQPFVSSLHGGPVIVMSLEPHAAYAMRSGLGTSTRAMAEQLWGTQLPEGDPEEMARILFACENPPGSAEISGSQDALGILLPGISRLNYEGDYWPASIESCTDVAILSWLQSHIFLKWLGSRPDSFAVLRDRHLDCAMAGRLAAAASNCWTAIEARDLRSVGAAVTESFEAQIAMFPSMTNEVVQAAIRSLPSDCLGYKLAGAGGLGYLAVVAEARPEGFDPIEIRGCVDTG